jgi:two-component system cell cycle sensor histidine kinase/response regulator CckA
MALLLRPDNPVEPVVSLGKPPDAQKLHQEVVERVPARTKSDPHGSNGAARSQHEFGHPLDDANPPLIRVLIVEDSRSDVLLLENELAGATSAQFEVTAVGRVSEAAKLLAKKLFDVVLTDLGLPDCSGLDTFLAIQNAATSLPVIVMTGLSDERMGIRAMRAGAQDYFIKGHLWENGVTRSIRDAIERRRADEAFRRSEARFRASIESLLDGFALLAQVRNQAGEISGFRIDYINESGLCFRPKDGAETAPKTIVDLFPDCHERGLFDELVRVAESGNPFARECVLLCQERGMDLTSPSYDFRAGKTSDGIALSWRDVTPRLRLEAQVLQSQKMNSIGQLASGIAHDFNNLLTVIHGHTDLMKEAKLPGKLADSLQEISAAALRATNLTNQLLTFSRQHPMVAADVDINETVAQMSNMLGRILGEDIRLHVEFRQPPPFVRADRGMIEQILLNLAVNSRDAMPKGGELIIVTSVRQVDAREVELESDVTPGRFVCLSVRDTGCGIEPDHLSKVFEPFFSTKEVGKGTGLGLATVYGIVKQHKGWMSVESKVGSGTVFKVYLPFFEAKASISKPAAEPPKPTTGNETILLVEDEGTIREMAKMFLETQGYQVMEASNGPEAVGIWEKDQNRIDLVVTDLVMPEGLTGRQLAERLQKDRADLKVIFSSGYSCDLFGEDSVLDADTNFLQKPYRLNTLAQMIRDCLDGARTPAIAE